ncbi:hypothetical protein [uncultured Photobacterium sp.]|uniref:hypothetical protein n=1 Tax=uncultured Photobacterium sp. TaxID=173973 RepID=UPI002610D61C|nr:hypothetical protein [uncultured Photobacterium sp.]
MSAARHISLSVRNIDVAPSATASCMTMGILPIEFTQQKDGWLGKFTVPNCTHDKMTWAIDLKINNDIYSSQFTVIK